MLGWGEEFVALRNSNCKRRGKLNVQLKKLGNDQQNTILKSRRGNKRCNIMNGKEDAPVHRLKENTINYVPVILKT